MSETEDDSGKSIDARHSKGFVYKPRGPVTQYFGAVINGLDERVFKRLGLDMRLGFALLAALVVVVVSASSFALYQSLRPSIPTCMTGDFRIAIANFSENGRSNSKVGGELAQNIYVKVEQILKELKLPFTVTVWEPLRVGSIEGATAQTRSKNAEQLAKRICADAVAYGNVDTTGEAWRVLPEFYVASEGSRLDELVGQYELGTDIPLLGQNNIADRIRSSSELAARMEALAKIVVGLSYYSVQQFDEALSIWQSAENIQNWDDDEGKQVLYVLIGSAAGKLGKLELAEQASNEALKIDPEYSRAYINLAGVYYIRSLKTAQANKTPVDTDAGLLQRAIETYQRASRATNQHGSADIPARVSFGLGQCYLAQTLSGRSDSFDPAVAEFEVVVKAYGEGANPRLQEWAAESHARLGLIYALSDNKMQAIAEYDKAAQLLTMNPTQQAEYQAQAKQLRGEK